MALTFSIPDEPKDVTRVVTSSGIVFDRDGSSWTGEWINPDEGSFDWVELLTEYGEVREVIAPTEAIKFLKKYDVDAFKLFREAPNAEFQKHLADIVEFAETLS